MRPNSRLLICDQVMNTTVGCDAIRSAPAPLPADYGYATRYSHQRDITMMNIINGIERTPDDFRELIEKAGLVMSRMYDCRSQVSLVECMLPRIPLSNNKSSRIELRFTTLLHLITISCSYQVLP